MTIDLSNNVIVDYTNTVPITLVQLVQTPEPRSYDLSNNNITYFSDLLLEKYGACTTNNSYSTAYFIVGITNVLLSNNPLICDCQSYNLITYISNAISDFPDISSGTALITKATCASPSSQAGKKFMNTDFSVWNNCVNYTLPNTTNIFCSVYVNDSRQTLPTPTYWPSTTITTTPSTGQTVLSVGVDVQICFIFSY